MNEVNANELKAMMATGNTIVIDVREQDEYDEAHIEGVHFLPMSRFNPQEVPVVKDGQDVVFQCRSGGRSAQMLQVYEAFFPDVTCHNFQGGIIAWQEAGFPVVQG